MAQGLCEKRKSQLAYGLPPRLFQFLTGLRDVPVFMPPPESVQLEVSGERPSPPGKGEGGPSPPDGGNLSPVVLAARPLSKGQDVASPSPLGGGDHTWQNEVVPRFLLRCWNQWYGKRSTSWGSNPPWMPSLRCAQPHSAIGRDPEALSQRMPSPSRGGGVHLDKPSLRTNWHILDKLENDCAHAVIVTLECTDKNHFYLQQENGGDFGLFLLWVQHF